MKEQSKDPDVSVNLDTAISQVTSDINEPSEMADAIVQKTLDEKAADVADEAAPKKRRGRPPKDPSKVKPVSFLGGSAAPAPQQSKEDLKAIADSVKVAKAAAAATGLVQTTGIMIAGEQGMMSMDDKIAMVDAFETYFKAKNITDFPPSIGLALAIGSYYVSVLTTEKAAPRIYGFYSWIKSKFRRKEKRNAPYPDTGNDQ